MTGSDVLFDNGLDFFGEVAARLEPQDWERTSPCEGWSALDVLGHLGSAMGLGVSILKGESLNPVDTPRPADLVEGDPLSYWQRTTALAREALAGIDLDAERDTPMGKRTVAEGLAFPAIDLYVHAWDVGYPAGISVEIPADAIDFAHTYLDPIPTETMRGSNGAFGPEVTPPDDATPTDRFIAWTGRNPRG